MFQLPEEWRPVPGYEDSYEVSDLGQVRRLERTVTIIGPHGGIGYRLDEARLLKTKIDEHGYVRVKFHDGKTPGVHQLVALAFLGPKPPGHEPNHGDGNKQNNVKSNLEWLTPSANQLHRCRVLKNGRLGEQHPSAKLNERQARKIFLDTRPMRIIASEYGISQPAVAAIRNRESWIDATAGLEPPAYLKHRRKLDACKRGHPFIGRNLIVRNGRQICRECSNERMRQFRARL